MKLLFAGGGTGGHLIPARNLAEWLVADRNKHEFRFLLAGRPVETSFFDDRNWPRTDLFEGAGSRPSLLRWGTWRKARQKASAVIREFSPDALVLSGGYVSLPALLAWGFRRNPVYVLEQNALPGKTVRLAAARAHRVFCHFEAAESYFRKKSLVTGSPLPPTYSGTGADLPAAARRTLGLKEGLPTLLVAGGSQGARAINDLVLKNLPRLAAPHKTPVQVLHVTGKADFERVQGGYQDVKLCSKVFPFLDPMEKAYRAADLILCRGGGMTVAEITAMGLPAVIVPYPHHRNRHQFENALEMVTAGGALVIEERDFSSKGFQRCIVDLLRSPDRLEEMAKRSRGLGRLSGGPRILETIQKDLNRIFPERLEDDDD